MTKIKNVIPKGGYRSSLELYCAEKLKEYNIPFTYESEKFVLVPKFKYPGKSIAKVGKKFTQQRDAQVATTYTPDFVGTGWIIETKGFLTPISQLKWKLFKSALLEMNYFPDLYMPTNRKQVDEVIKDISEKKN